MEEEDHLHGDDLFHCMVIVLTSESWTGTFISGDPFRQRTGKNGIFPRSAA